MKMNRTLPDAMRAELATVLASPVFVRSPVLSRLLAYLVEESIEGRAGRLKSYTVAVDGLGREAEHDPQLDTYSRVAMVRLRRTLETYYRAEGRGAAERLSIPMGSYEVVLLPAEPAAPSEAAGSQPAGGMALLPRWRKALWPALVLLAVIALVTVQWLRMREAEEAANWQQSNFPYVLVTFGGASAEQGSPEQREVAEDVRDAIRSYETIRLAGAMRADVTYVLDLSFEEVAGQGRQVMVEVQNVKLNRQVYKTSFPAPGAKGPDEAGKLAIARAVFDIFGYAGQIQALEARNSPGPDTPYDCWLRFSQQVRIEPMFNDPQLSRCADKWESHAPQRPMAIFVHAWTETNGALASMSTTTREKNLREVLRQLEAARSRYPASRHIQLALVRTYALLGYSDSVRQAVAELSIPDQPSPDIANLAGTFIVLQNDLSGEALIDRSIAFHRNPPGRYFLGKFIAAMMRDDVPGAGVAMERMVVENRSAVWGQVMQAAWLARSGRTAEAKAIWKSAVAQRPMLGISPALAISNSPASPEVERRLLEWLDPLIR